MFQFSGYRGANPQLLGTDGQFHRTNKPLRAKPITLNFRGYGRDATGIVTSSVREHLEVNMDGIFELIAAAGEQAILERDMADGTTRWIRIQIMQGVAFSEGPFFNNEMGSYDLPVFALAAYPFWQSETQHTQVVTPGADTIVNAGNARISNGSYAIAGAGSFTNDDDGDVLTATAAVTIDVGAKTISNGGSPTPGRMDPPNRDFWFRLGPGTTNVTAATVNTTVVYRDHWH